MRSLVLSSVLLLAGCHGTELRLGTGRSFNDFSGSSTSSGDWDDHGGGSSSFDFDQDDSTSAWVELGFQLTPQTVVVEQSGTERNSAHYSPPLAVTPDILAAIEARLLAIEEETGDHISWSDIGIGGGTAGSGVGLLWLAWTYWRRKREATG